MIKWSEIGESFRIATNALRTNLLRSVLTTSGVVVGVVLVVVMGWTINGLDAIWDETISIIGKDMIYVDKWNWSGGGNWRKTETRKDITLEQAQALVARMETSELAIPLARQWGGSVSYGNKSIRCGIYGTTFEYAFTPAGVTEFGRYFNEVEQRQADNVVVIGYGIAKAIFPDGDALDKQIKIHGIPFRIIGVVEKRGFLFMDFIDNQAFIPLFAFRSAFGFFDRSFSIGIKAGSVKLLDIVRDEAIGHMRQIRNVHPTEEEDFSINETEAFDDQVRNIRIGIWTVGIGLTILAFIVGSIGIMNIMYVSVTERTREIGIRKAIGAKRFSILSQFLIESALLCLTGAFIAFPISQGLIAGIYWTARAGFDLEFLSVVSPLIQIDLLLIAIAVSVAVGLLAGLLPAFKASRLAPVEALRYE
ncbi:MAG: ABC transporter permease [Ignavibacteria bacterium]|nr:ABC transporter permease [Ignavibacteria bacterium]